MTHDYVPRPDGFRTAGVIGDERVEGVPCAICSQFESQHVAPLPEVVAVEPEPVAAKTTVEKPAAKRAVKKTTAKKPAAKKSSAKKTTSRRTKK
jgi:hypothetical protein